MSDILTRIFAPGCKQFSGLQDWGRKTPDEMISQIRSYAKSLQAEAEAILAIEDHEFQVDVVRGSIVQHHVKELQRSTRPRPAPQGRE